MTPKFRELMLPYAVYSKHISTRGLKKLSFFNSLLAIFIVNIQPRESSPRAIVRRVSKESK